MMEQVEYQHLLIFFSFMVATWINVIYFLPKMLLSVFKKGILVKGFGDDGPVQINTLYTQPQELFADPLNASGSKLMTTGVNRDTLLVVGWLDLRKGPQILHVPDMSGRYYSVQFTNPAKNTNFAYVGKRTTGTEAGAYLISAPGWQGDVPQGVPQISSPNNSVLVIGRIFVDSDSDIPTSYELAKQIQLSALTQP